MVGICSALIALGLWLGISWWRERDIPQTRWFLRAVAVSGVASVVALECGWIVTEVGRQPWVVYNVMRTTDAVTDADGVWVTFVAVVVALYAVLGAALALTLRAMARRWRAAAEPEPETPYGPRSEGPPPAAAEVGHDDGGRRGGRAVGRRDRVRRVRGAPTSGRGSGACSPGGASVARRVRALVDWAIGPIWEANHVWLIFVLVCSGRRSRPLSRRSSRRSSSRSASPRWASCCAAPGSRSTRPRRPAGARPPPSACSACRRCSTPVLHGHGRRGRRGGRVPLGNAKGTR